MIRICNDRYRTRHIKRRLRPNPFSESDDKYSAQHFKILNDEIHILLKRSVAVTRTDLLGIMKQCRGIRGVFEGNLAVLE